MSGELQAQMPSVMSPAGTEAAALHEVSVVLFVGAAIIFAGTMALLIAALRRPSGPGVPTAWWVVGGGIALPVVVLSGLLFYSTARTAGLERTLADPPLVVSVTGRMWWWEVRYRDPAGGDEIVSANELRIPLDRPTQIALGSADVIHSLWVPELGGKRDLVPGRVNHLVITPRKAGTYRGQCAEYCGLQHARMALHVVVLPPADFERWLAQQSRPAARAEAPRLQSRTDPAVDVPAASALPASAAEASAVPTPAASLAQAPGEPARPARPAGRLGAPAAEPSPAGETLVANGRRAFVEQGCAACHTVRGDAEGAQRGPDLTHLASRVSLGAGVLANEPGAVKRWLVGVQDLKPGAHMPSYAHLDAQTLDALTAYLDQLQ